MAHERMGDEEFASDVGSEGGEDMGFDQPQQTQTNVQMNVVGEGTNPKKRQREDDFDTPLEEYLHLIRRNRRAGNRVARLHMSEDFKDLNAFQKMEEEEQQALLTILRADRKREFGIEAIGDFTVDRIVDLVEYKTGRKNLDAIRDNMEIKDTAAEMVDMGIDFLPRPILLGVGMACRLVNSISSAARIIINGPPGTQTATQPTPEFTFDPPPGARPPVSAPPAEEANYAKISPIPNPANQ